MRIHRDHRAIDRRDLPQRKRTVRILRRLALFGIQIFANFLDKNDVARLQRLSDR